MSYPMRDAWKNFRPSSTRQHSSFEEGDLLLPELDILGWIRFSEAMADALHPGRHRDAYEVCLLVNGLLDWWVEDSQYEYNAGQIMLIRPGELHGARHNILQCCELYWFRLHLPGKQGYPFLGERLTNRLLAAFDSSHTHIVPAPDNAQWLFRRIFTEHLRPSESSPKVCQSALQILLCDLTEAFGDSESLDGHSNETDVSYWVRKSIRVLRQHDFTQTLSINDWAQLVGLKEGTFRKYFEQEMGMSPKAYIARERILKAKEMLLSGHNVTDAAHALGFSSSQYFSTAFRRMTGNTPTEFVEQHATPET